MDEGLKEHRKFLVAAEHKAQDDYDKALLALAGGALGVSFAFVKDVIGSSPADYVGSLVSSWVLWGLSILFVLASHWASQRALRTAIGQVDSGKAREEKPGRHWAPVTAILNAIGGLLFGAGVVTMAFFVYVNTDRIGKGPPARSGDTDLQLVASVGPFDDGDTTLPARAWLSFDSATVSLHRRDSSSATGYLLLGGVDPRPLTPAAAKKFQSIRQLATLRADVVRGRLRTIVGDSVPVTIVPRGALEGTKADWSRDRRVDLYSMKQSPRRLPPK